MYLLLEHDGTKEANLKAKELIDFLETELGATVETMIGTDSDSLKIFDEDFNLIVSINKDENINEDILMLIFRLNDK